jgi:hypothetical protein
MTEEFQPRYSPNPLWWLIVLVMAAIWSATLVNLDLGNRAFTAGWDQPMRQACSTHSTSCLSVQLFVLGGWLKTEHRIHVHSRPGQREVALALVYQALSDAQRAHVTVTADEIASDSAPPKRPPLNPTPVNK